MKIHNKLHIKTFVLIFLKIMLLSLYSRVIAMFERNILNIWWHYWLIPIFHTYKYLHKYNAGRTITAVMTVCISCMSEEHTLQAKKESPFYILSPKLVYSRTEEVYTKTIEGNICIKKMVIGQCDLHYSLCNILSMG